MTSYFDRTILKRIATRLRRAKFEVEIPEDDIVLNVSKHNVSACLTCTEGSVTICEFSSFQEGQGNGRRFLKDLAACYPIYVHDVGDPVGPGKEPEGYQKFWAKMFREGLVVELWDCNGAVIEADEIDPPGTTPAP